jgi:Ca2+-binding RTX toxin-like protein
VGLTGKRAGYEQGDLFALQPAKRCGGIAEVDASLVDSTRGAFQTARPVRPRRLRLRLRGAPRRSLRLAAYEFLFGGIDPTALIVLVGRLPRDIATAESRRVLVVTLSVRSEDEGCLKRLRKEVSRLHRRVYLRVAPGATPLAPALPSASERIDALAYDRVAGMGSLGGTPSDIQPAGDLDGDGLGDLLMQGPSDDAKTGGVIRFGGPPSLSDARALDGRGFTILGRFDDARLGSVIGSGGDFTGDGQDDLAVGLQGSDRRGRRPRPPQEDAVVVIPGAHYRGAVDARAPPAGSIRVTVKPGCSPFETRVAAVGDVNGDGVDDIAVDRPDGCGDDRAGIVFGGWRGSVSLDAPGAAGIALRSSELGEGFAAAGDVNGDGLDDVALVDGPDAATDGNAADILVLLGRRTPGPVSLKTDPGVLGLAGDQCGQLTDVAPAGDLDGDGIGELAVGVQDCHERKYAPVVAYIVQGSRALRGTVALNRVAAATVRSRFGPLGGPQVAAGRDVTGGPRPDLALGFPRGGPNFEGETWLISDMRLGEQLTLGSLGARARRLLGPTYRETFGSDVTIGLDRTGDGRADLSILSAEAEFGGQPQVTSVYTLAPTGQAAPRCANVRSGAARLSGSDGGDRITGSPHADRILGYLGADCLFGGSGPDRLVGDPGEDLLVGGPGNDRLLGGAGRDRLEGGRGADYLAGNGQPDTISAGSGNDRVDARLGGGDNVRGGSGRDFIRSSDSARDTINCGPGRDRAIADRGDRLRRCEVVKRKRPEEYDD